LQDRQKEIAAGVYSIKEYTLAKEKQEAGYILERIYPCKIKHK
jgi:hypothetical protein